MDTTHLVRAVLFWDSEHASDVNGLYDVSSASDDDNDNNDEEDGISTPVNPLSSTTVNQWQNMGSGEQIDDFIESSTIKLLDWNDTMNDLQLGMRFFNKKSKQFVQFKGGLFG
ncbi:hypothetical protein M9H77_10918 [Catharanthus roseus]|uniref:Uncharacterized protein n=1 Tax=Catharanthus roseus TaxID=4058 RepID=A0ACC0BD58_CATRO|nr:hypothetical protein M9H77_10918 [Catharanthus roseus]